MLTLQSSNGIEFELDQELAKTSVTIKNLIEDAGIEMLSHCQVLPVIHSKM